MKISYNWLKDYLPKDEQTAAISASPQKLGEILTSVGLEVEGIEKFEQVKNGLEGLFTGQVISCEKHPGADKLKVTKVDVGGDEMLQIVCGAPNVAAGQKVIVATSGTTLYPTGKEPLTIKKAKIRGLESDGMLCSENEFGMGSSHDGIMVLPADTKTGMPAAEFFQLYTDSVIEIGLTPNRMDAMSHLGVAKDICAYLSHHQKRDIRVVSPFSNHYKPDKIAEEFSVEISDPGNCPRYAGVYISGISVQESPAWLQNKLRSIGLKPVNNVVDITNFVLHETGQPLHAFDADKIVGKKIIVQTLAEGTPFKSLDGKVRTLSSEDIMICDGADNPMCIAGVFGGETSGVSPKTVNVFLESAVFDPAHIRRSMLRHNLRTDAAIRFEKGIDISNTVNVLKRAALLIKEVGAGSISSNIVDEYPVVREKTEILLSNHYLKKISGKNYHPDTVKNILRSLNFTIQREGLDHIQVAVPFSNPDITLPADVIEEIMRIDGLDNIEIPATIQMIPAVDTGIKNNLVKDKIISWLNGNGFSEIFTNSLTNSRYFDEETLAKTVKIINSLSIGLDVMRPSMLPTGLECVSYNINRKNNDLHFLEFGKTYSKKENAYFEKENLALYFTGNQKNANWNGRAKPVDIFYVKGICDAIFKMAINKKIGSEPTQHDDLEEALCYSNGKKNIAFAGRVADVRLNQFSIRQPVYYVCIDWQALLSFRAVEETSYVPVPKFPSVHRDLSMVLDQNISYQSVAGLVGSLNLKKLTAVKLFDVFQSEKLGGNKKSFAISFTFLDQEKTLTDKEIDSMMTKIIEKLESGTNAEIRRNA